MRLGPRRLGQGLFGRRSHQDSRNQEDHDTTAADEETRAGTASSPRLAPQREDELRDTIASLTERLEQLGGPTPSPATGPGPGAPGTSPGPDQAAGGTAGGTGDADERVRVLNELGAACAELGETEEAITHYEASMGLHEQFGPAYNGLLTLYNDMLRQAAQRKDADGVQHWTTRLDGLTALSKRVMRSQY